MGWEGQYGYEIEVIVKMKKKSGEEVVVKLKKKSKGGRMSGWM